MKKITAILICIIMIIHPLAVSAEEYSSGLLMDYYVAFEPWQGKGDATAEVVSSSDRLPAVYEEFLRLTRLDEEVDPENYTVAPGEDCVLLTLKEDYLSTFPDGKHYFQVHFKQVRFDLKLYVFREKTVVTDVVFNFDEWTPGDGLPCVMIESFDKNISIGPELIECIKYGDEIVDKKNYTISQFADIIFVHFTEQYYYSLPSGTNYFDIEFMSVSGVKLKLDIPPRDHAGDVADVYYYWYDSKISGSVCYIDNDYMKLYHDLFFKDMYENYLTLPDFEFYNGEKISSGLYEDIKYFVNDNFYLCLYLNEIGADVSTIDGVSEIKYTGEEYPCAVVKVVGGDDIDSVLADEKVEYVGYSFSFVAPFWGDPGHSVQRLFKASDARKVLRIAAGLDKIEHRENYSHLDEYINFFARDIDMNGKLTAHDARGVLRIAAGLDTSKHIIYPY